jgi:hypothetical protein
MQIDTPEGKLTIEDDSLRFEPADNGPTLDVSLDPMPDYKYERGIYGTGGLVISGQYIVLRNDQAETVITELRRPRRPKSAKNTDKPAQS